MEKELLEKAMGLSQTVEQMIVTAFTVIAMNSK